MHLYHRSLTINAVDTGEAGLGLIPGMVTRFEVAESHGLSVPAIGWNGVNVTKPSPLLPKDDPGAYFYFVHSFKVLTSSFFGSTHPPLPLGMLTTRCLPWV